MKILILSASTGGGHKQASNALASIINKKSPNAEVRVVDAIEYCGHFYNKTVSGGYHYLATKTPKLYGTVYKISDRETKLNGLVGLVNDRLGKKIYPLFEEFQPDIVVSCHPFVTEMVARLKELGLISIPLIAIITDFAPHRTYVRECVDAYVVANDEMVDTLQDEYKVSREKIYSLGIPINPIFYQKKDVKKITEDLGFDPNIPIMLIMAGSFGVTDILKIYESITEIENELQIIVITGRNKHLYDAFEKLTASAEEEFLIEESINPVKNKLSKLKEQINEKLNERLDEIHISRLFKRSTHASKPTKLFYFVNNVADYMAVSDLIITKPGGLTVSESLASALPMLVFNAIPGQEEYNADYLVRHNMALRLEKGISAAQQIKPLLDHPERLKEMSENCRKFCKEHSAEHIYNLILKMLNDTIQIQSDI